MAQRRMFSRRIVESGAFLRMPALARLLYYDLGMAADDDGFVEAFPVLRLSGATEDDLRALEAKGFIRVLNEDLLCWIAHWSENNRIRKDRYTPSVHNRLLARLTGGGPDDDPVATKCQPEGDRAGDGPEPQVSSGQVSPGQANSLDEEDDIDVLNRGQVPTLRQRTIYQSWEREFGTPPVPAVVRTLDTWLGRYDFDYPDIIREVVAETAMRCANDPLAYAVALLKDWAAHGVRTAEDLDLYLDGGP